jgi:nicotinamidase-related amidase
LPGERATRISHDTGGRAIDRLQLNAALLMRPDQTVALTVDMQRAYLDPAVGDKLVPPAEAAAIVAAAAHLLDACRSMGVPVVHAYVNRLPVELAARQGNSRFAMIAKNLGSGVAAQPPDRPAGSPQADVHPALVQEGDIHVRSKKTTDSYFGTELALLFEQVLRPSTVILMGINTETCVYATTFGTKVRGYQPVVASDCVGSHRDPDNTRLALELMGRTIAWTLSSAEIVAKLRAAQS